MIFEAIIHLLVRFIAITSMKCNHNQIQDLLLIWSPKKANSYFNSLYNQILFV